MKAKELIGKKAIRTAPVQFNGDRSFTREPILILAAGDSHIKFRYIGPVFMSYSEHILGPDWNDDNWADYETLFEKSSVNEEQNCSDGKIGVGIGKIHVAFPNEYVVLENYQPELLKLKPLSDYTARELAAELLRRYDNE